MEELWKECLINDAELRKKMVGRYADSKSELEWRALDKFAVGHSWEEFKTELIGSYPEALDQVEGSVAKLKEVCRANARIDCRDEGPLKKLKRELMPQAKNLLAMKPPAITNREIVTEFLGCLTEGFRSQLLARLSITGSTRAVALPAPTASLDPVEIAAAQASARRKGDHYELEQVIATAISMSEGITQMSTGDYNRSLAVETIRPGSSSEITKFKTEFEEVKIQVNGIKDTMAVNEKHTQSSFAEMLKVLQQQAAAQQQQVLATQGLFTQLHNSSVAAPQYKNNYSAPPPPQREPRRTEHYKCHYCQQVGHFIGACPEKQRQADEGKIKLTPEGALRFPDGSMIPREPEAISIKDKVEQHHAKKLTNLYFGDVTAGNQNGVLTLQQTEQREGAETMKSILAQLSRLQLHQTVSPPAVVTPPPCADYAALENQNYVNANYAHHEHVTNDVLHQQIEALTSQLAQTQKDSGFH